MRGQAPLSTARTETWRFVCLKKTKALQKGNNKHMK